MKQERILAVHDISCVGRCSLTVALPIVSSVGIECSGLPTAVLSTHTGGFTGFTYRDLTGDLMDIDAHWGTLDIKFDAVYTGFLGSFEQIDIVERIISDVSHEGTTVYVDPVMADKGKLYTVFGPDFPAGMRKLCERADVIIPNLTELSFMLGIDYVEGPYTREYIDTVFEQARVFGVDRMVVTGISFEAGKVGAVYIDYTTGETGEVMRDEIPGYFHGTGDVFGSAFVAASESGLSLGAAVEAAVNLTVGSIQRTVEAGTDIRYGVNFEAGLRDFIDEVEAGKARILISRVTDGGVGALSALAHEAWHDAYDDMLPPGQPEYMLDRFQSPEAVRSQMAEGMEYHVATIGGEPVGYIGFQPTDYGAFLSKLYVLDRFQGLGVASALLDVLRAGRSGTVRLTVYRGNEPAIGFYLSKGFEVVRDQDVPIGDGYTMYDHVMELEL
ncbi:MAG: pyridoxamine kinase [Candidatus Methanomethylophilaceae archaeon]|nr:pyridoxamine kinase [Candidatus Methanomethylophilaceae archaeon]